MKKLRYFFFLIAILTSTLVYSQNNPLVGKWLTINGGDSFILELTNDGIFYLTASYEEDTLGGMHQYTDDFGTGEDSIFLDYKYDVDMSVFPHKLTLTAYYSGTDSFCFIFPAVFEFKEKNTIKLILYEEGIHREGGDDPELIMKEFYTDVKIDEDFFEIIEFKLLT